MSWKSDDLKALAHAGPLPGQRDVQFFLNMKQRKVDTFKDFLKSDKREAGEDQSI